MGSVLAGLPREERVGVIRLRSLGDCVLTTPALDILKRFRPDLRVAIMVEERFRAVFEGSPDIERILPPTLAALRSWRPALCLNLHGGTRSAWITALSGARFRAGFGHFRHRAAYNLHISRAQEILGCERTVHTAEHLASAMFYLGAPVGEIPRAKLVVGAGGGAPGRSTAAIHAVAAAPEKAWRADGFLAVAEYLKQTGLEPVFLGGAGDDLSPFRAYRAMAGAPLAEIKALLAGAALFVGNDSGPAHMAAAFGVPSVVVFGRSDPAIWGPWRTVSRVIQSPEGIGRVKVADVLDAVAGLKAAA